MPPRQRKRKTTRRPQRKRGARKAAPPSTKRIKNIVKKELSNQIENKYIAKYQLGDAPNNEYNPVTATLVGTGYITQDILTNNDFYRILPAVQQGPGTADRVGTIIRPKSLRTQLQFAFNGDYNGSLNLQVRVIAFTLKQVKGYETFVNSTVNYALKMGWNASTFTPSTSPAPIVLKGGEPYYLNMPINKREVNVVMDDTFTLTKGQGQARDSSARPTGGDSIFLDSYRGVHEMTVKWDPPKTFKYDDNMITGQSYPSNYAPFIAVIYTQMDGLMSVNTADNIKLVVLNMRTALSYEDA